VPLASLPSDRGRLLACVPHGIVPYGVMLLWLEVLRQGRLLGGLGASVLFRLPLLRQFLGAIGIEPATPRALAAKLRVPGSDTFLVPGGIAEMFLNDPDLEVVQIATRKGFCKHALRAGACVCPVYIFGQTQLFYTLGGRAQELLRRLSRYARVSLVPFVGRSWLSPFVPLQRPLTAVIGRPLNVHMPPVPSPTPEQIDALHAQFCSELRRLFDEHKASHPGFAHKTLHFEDDDTDELRADEVRALEAQRERRQLEEFHLFPSRL